MEQPDKIRFDLTRTAFGYRVRDNTFIFWRKCGSRPLPALERVIGWGLGEYPRLWRQQPRNLLSCLSLAQSGALQRNAEQDNQTAGVQLALARCRSVGGHSSLAFFP